MKQLFCDCRTDAEKRDFFLSGRAVETGVIAAAISNDVAMAYHRCDEFKKEVDALRASVRHEADCVEAAKVEIEAMRATQQLALEALENVRGNINPERGYADELEADVERAIAAIAQPAPSVPTVADNFVQPAPSGEDDAVRKSWARFSNALHRSPDAPYPGMSEAFEKHFSQSFTDREWRAESGTWAAAWKAAKNHGAQPAPSFADAYQGAMEEVAIWKKRALEAEDLNRKFVAEINGPTYMGEPAQPAPIVPDDGFKRAVMEIKDIGYGAIFKHLICERAAELAAAPKPEAKP